MSDQETVAKLRACMAKWKAKNPSSVEDYKEALSELDDLMGHPRLETDSSGEAKAVDEWFKWLPRS